MPNTEKHVTPHATTAVAAALMLLAAAASPACAPSTGGAGASPAAASSGTPAVAKPGGWNDPPKEASPNVKTPPLSGKNLILNATFDGNKSLPWSTSFTVPGAGKASVENGELCVEVTNKGANRWDVQVRHRQMVIQKGHTYSVQFKMHATQKTSATAKIGNSGPPYKDQWVQKLDLEPQPKIFRGTFTTKGDDDPTAEFAFHLGGQMARLATVPFTVCVDDVNLDDPEFTPKPVVPPDPVPLVLVNQTGYLPHQVKIATVRNPAAVKWELVAGGKNVVASGTTTPVGADPASGDQVSIADFTSFTKDGTGYVVRVGADASRPFDIRADLYGKMKYQALAYFYHNRSGIEIKMPYAGEPQYARPAGHVDVPPNKGDKKVTCHPDSPCSYALDVTGGWYDAGDHGKYVVNGGISIWTLLNWWERVKHLGTSAADFEDGKLAIPENKNKVPDLLDEARWEMDWELRMQVPQDQKLAGMVHHKMHDMRWTEIGTPPHLDPIERYLQPPSTAATLNMAANAAQAARIWKTIDKAFADKCLTAAERAWAAAQANPAIYAPPGGENGGGPYDDKDVTDEFYWAAAELFITTKKPVYKDFISKSPYYKKVDASAANDGNNCAMSWGATAALGSISLAVAPSALGADVDAIKKNIVAAADVYVGLAQKEGYRLPFNAPPKGYPWGSNSSVLNNAMVLGLAHDFTQDAKYLQAMVLAMDYILGRNAIDQSYVTGYGERPLQNPHHRFWAFQANSKLPPPPPGVVSGGPNSGMEDPYIQGAGLKGCAPQKCFIDNIESWSSNEITINWNSPLAWVVSYIDEKEGPKWAGKKKK